VAADTREIEAGSEAKGGKVRLLALDDLDGRTRAGQFVRETKEAVLADVGGEDDLSVLERLAIDNVTLTAAMIRDAGVRWLKGEPIDPAAVATLANSFNRSADKIGWKRRAKDVTTLSRFLNVERAP
jgi:hypothetical protein